jgi:peptidoglycan hydrolase-like protein with peptidoglycan-binding domain
MAIQITASVGKGGTNRKADVKKIQSALNAVYPSLALVVDGLCGPKTIRRIEKFQRRFMHHPDGRVDPGGRTLKRLNTAVPDLRSEWSGDSAGWSQEKKLDSLDKRMRLRVEKVIEELKEEGFRPKIVYAWRSVTKQLELVEAGRSRVRFSFHNAQKKDGTPNAYAADIIDKRWAWNRAAEQNGFWEALGRLAKEQDLYWGGDWISFKDWAHVQYYPNYMLSEIKRESGIG